MLLYHNLFRVSRSVHFRGVWWVLRPTHAAKIYNRHLDKQPLLGLYFVHRTPVMFKLSQKGLAEDVVVRFPFTEAKGSNAGHKLTSADRILQLALLIRAGTALLAFSSVRLPVCASMIDNFSKCFHCLTIQHCWALNDSSWNLAQCMVLLGSCL